MKKATALIILFLIVSLFFSVILMYIPPKCDFYLNFIGGVMITSILIITALLLEWCFNVLTK